MKRKWIIGLGIICFAVLLSGVTMGMAADKKIVIKYADFHPLETLNYQTQLKFEKILEEKTQGRVDVQLFPGAQLGGQRDLIEQVKLGRPVAFSDAFFKAIHEAKWNPFCSQGMLIDHVCKGGNCLG